MHSSKKQQERDKPKHELAKQLITNHGMIQISTQVVNEVCINLMRKAARDNAYIFNFTRSFMNSYTVHQQTIDDLMTAAALRLENRQERGLRFVYATLTPKS